MRAVVIGGSGQIGNWLLRVLKDRGHSAVGTFATVPFPGLEPLDAANRDASAAWLRAQRPDVVFYPAGFTWVDGCERDPARAYASNLEEPLHLATAAADSHARFVYYSTDYVFNGQSGPYAEDAPVSPLSVYGRAKADAESAIRAALGDHALIARTSWVFGPERQGKNFAYQLIRSLSAGKSLTCPSDQRSNPSYGPDVALASVLLAEQERSGLVHVVGPDLCDRVQFAHALARGFKLDPDLIVSQTTAEIGQTTARPLDGGLKTLTLNEWLPDAIRPLDEAIKDFRRLVPGEPWSDPFASDT